jgi:oxalate decarboxylase/phosphoglucose isomerase-like protein (cupin superfamily)
LKNFWSEKMKLSICDIGGEVVKDNETYLLKDNKTLKNLVVSSTMLHPGKETRGHAHAGQEEVYQFVSGKGLMQLTDTNGTTSTFSVGPGDVVLIEDGVYHRVFNTNATESLYFVCVFDGKRNH